MRSSSDARQRRRQEAERRRSEPNIFVTPYDIPAAAIDDVIVALPDLVLPASLPVPQLRRASWIKSMNEMSV